jgi:hypothetical protein
MEHLRRLGPVTANARTLCLSDTLLVSSDQHTEQWSLDGEKLAEWEGGRTVRSSMGVLSTTRDGAVLRPGPTRLSLYGRYGSIHGGYTLTATGKGAVIRRLPDLAPLARVDPDACDHCEASPDGRLLAARDYYHVELIALPERTTLRVIPATNPHVAFSPDSRRLIVVSPDGLTVTPVGPGEPLPVPARRFDYECRVAALDGERVVVSDQGTLWLWGGGGWQEHRPPGATDARRPRRPCPLAVADGLLAALDPDGSVHLWSVPGAVAARRGALTLPAPEPERLDRAVVCLSGAFTQLGKGDATARIEALGGRVARSPVKDLTHLVYGQPRYSGPIKETGADRKVRARVAAGEPIARWSESRLISALIPGPAEAARQLREDPAGLVAWMRLLAGQRVADRRFLSLVDQDLSGLDLREVPLEEVSAQGADLRGADLRGAALSYVLLTGADLSGAEVDGLTTEWCVWDETTVWPEGYAPPPSR